jgi:DNA-binding beta-propeller fold protein YncE
MPAPVARLSDAFDVVIDPVRGKVYWTDDVTNKIQRANLDGRQVEDLVNAALGFQPLAIALDPSTGKIYCRQSQPPRKPARRSPAFTYGQRRMISQIRPVR